MEDNVKMPYAVICPLHKQVFLTSEQYEEQMYRINALWRCPMCNQIAAWDDKNFEDFFSDPEFEQIEKDGEYHRRCE
jgi:hypothetical protein